MASGGHRTRPQQSSSSSSAQRPSASSRNEAFESIFGRPSVAHHVGGPSAPGAGGHPAGMTPPGPPPGGSYGYGGGRGAQAPGAGPTYLSPAQPSYPPGQIYNPAPPPLPRPAPQLMYPPQNVYQPPPRGESALYPSRSPYDNQDTVGRLPTQANIAQGGYASQPAPNRRASLAPSTYSTASSTSFYSPNPDTASPPIPRGARLPSGPTPPPPSNPSWPSESAPSIGHVSRGPSTRLPPPASGGMSAAQAYQASTGYSAASSPASVVFPHRANERLPPLPSQQPAHPNQSFISLATQSSSSTNSSYDRRDTSSHPSQSRSPPPRRATHDDSRDRPGFSARHDYVEALSNLSFDGTGSGPLDSVAGIPRKGEVSSSWGLDKWTSEDASRSTPQPPARNHVSNQSSVSSGTSVSTHRRMASDSSLTSSGYTISSAHPRPHLAPMSTIDQYPNYGPESPVHSPTTATGSEAGFAAHAQRRLSGRKSMDSTLSLPLINNFDNPLPPGAAASASIDNRATSFSGTTNSRSEVVSALRSGSVGHSGTVSRAPPSSFPFATPHTSQRSLTTLTRSSSIARAMTLRQMPHIYPALLSRVAEAFRQLIPLAEVVKDGITYKDAFDGRTAVAAIADIIKTSDRNLALLLGRALDAQKFFHDVTYDHRLRDNSNEVYQFREKLPAPFTNPAVTDSPNSDHAHLSRALSSSSAKSRTLRRPPPAPYMSDSTSIKTSDSAMSMSFSSSNNNTPATSATNLSAGPASSPQLLTKMNSTSSMPHGLAVGGIADEYDSSEDDLPVGVFTLLTGCYSPTCSRDSLCYSINCPRRLEQMKRLNMKPQGGLSRKLSSESLGEVKETGTLWIHSVSQEILDSVDDTEKKRQEAINEVIYTERDFVRDLEYLRDAWVKPLRSQDIVAANRRDDFVRQVFWNVHDVLTVNHPLAERLTKRQKQQPVVQTIGDIFLERVPLFEPFVTYGAHQLFGKYEFEKEKGANPAFQRFVDETERRPESRKLELNGYLTKPTTRLGRYPLLLSAVLKYTPDDSPDKKDLTKAIEMIKALLTKVNIESGKSENIFELAQLEQQLVFRPNETIDLRLRDKNRELVHKGPLKRRGGSREEIADLLGVLFDHAFLLVKPKYVNKAEQYRVYRRPIPLELLVVISPDDTYNSAKLSGNRAKLIARPSAHGGKSASSLTHVPPKPESKHGFSITIIHLGKKGFSMQLWVDTYVSRKKWLEQIDKQQNILRERSCVFVAETITEGYFLGIRKINCISPYDNGNRMIYGTDEGVYFSNLRDEKLREPVKVINLLDVTQVDVIEEFQLLIVLHERSVTTFPLDCLDPNDPNSALKRGKRISSHTSFFKSGVCLGKMLVAVVKSSTLSSTIKVLEPIDQTMRGKKPQTSFMKRLNGANEALKLFKEFYIPTESSSVHFLKTKLCVGCTKGFEIVDLETLDMQGLLDPSDASLDFVLKRDNVRPIAIYRIEEDFLLCYDEFAFYINKNGWRSRPKWAIIWEGMPTAFALQYPYVIAFDPTFIEVHHVESGHLVQILPSSGISCLFADTPPSRVNAPPPPQNRQLMYPPQGNGGPRYGNPAQGYPQRPPPPGQAPGPGLRQPSGGFPPPPPPMVPPPQARFARQQIIFTADDGHVQFLKFPLPTAPGSGSGSGSRPMHGTRPSH